jgi:hypothetical protein
VAQRVCKTVPEITKCYEQTQHLIENKELHLGEPSNCLKNGHLSAVTQHVLDSKRVAIERVRKETLKVRSSGASATDGSNESTNTATPCALGIQNVTNEPVKLLKIKMRVFVTCQTAENTNFKPLIPSTDRK